MKCIRGKYILVFVIYYFKILFVGVHVHSWTFAVVPTDMAIHECLRSILYSMLFIMWGYM